MEIQKIREAVNPVFNTAKSCAQFIAAAGDEDAKKIIDVLKFPSFGTHVPEKLIPKEILDKVKQLFPAYAVLIESRFRTMNQLIGSRKDRQIVDLPCGYTPRGIHLSRQGRIYFGFDLPAVIDDISRAAESIIGKDNNIAYHAVDATNYESLKAPFTDENQNFMITTEGLLMYFSQSEIEEVFKNIHKLLQKHGGSWVTTDRAYFFCDRDRDIAHAALDYDEQLTSLYEAITHKAASITADVKFNNNEFFDTDENKAMAFVDRMGFELKKIPMIDYLPEKLATVSESANAAIRKIFKDMYFWEMTVKAAAQDRQTDEKPFSIDMTKNDTVLHLSVSGRLDTLTAPELLKKFREITEPIDAIELHVEDMTYISSAGLRVLLVMYKSLEDNSRFKIYGVGKNIREIIETTGFDSIFL